MNHNHATVLVADDEANIRLLLRTALETEGYSVTEAADGRAALVSVEHAVPDLLLLDLNLPLLDGLAVLEHLQLLPPHRKPRVIVLTAYGSVPVAAAATRLGAADFLQKPVKPAQLRLAVANALDHPPPRP